MTDENVKEEVPQPNTFAEMEKKGVSSEEKVEPMAQPGEINLSDFSDVAVGDKIKYVRPDLNGKDDVVDKFQIFMPNILKDEVATTKGGSEYWPVTMILTYESKNEDDVDNREYISGCKAWKQKDGSASEPNFWYPDGVENGAQSSYLWECVARSLVIEPKDMTPRQFVAFLNNKPKVKILGMEYKNFNAPIGAPKKVTKNMPEIFIKA